ncbi:magnetosome protein MamC [Desulfovibrio sp. JC010]|uniref:magnetosome protein MamC n=1 Tax=Desulfovibrio sp. JC010 TaxID=2593641 RepID=UPI0013D8AD44|nr:magnetosome protein MamC [Desulfovibrio sp. JC010]NDV28539.1 hypothetical protein [Desulfovibrio sp. JC010]
MAQNNDKTTLLQTTLGTAFLGAIIGGTGAAAKAIREVSNEQKSKEEAVIDVAKEAGATAVAAGVSAAAVGALKLGPVLSTVGIIAVATGTKYAMDSVLKPAEALAEVKAPAKKKHAPLVMEPKAKPKKKHAPLVMESKEEKPKKTTKAAAKKTTTKKTTAKKTTAKKETTQKAAPKKTTAKKTTAKKAEVVNIDSSKSEPTEK